MNVVQYNYMYILITVNRMAVPKSKRTSCTNGSIPVRQRWRHVESKQERKKEDNTSINTNHNDPNTHIYMDVQP